MNSYFTWYYFLVLAGTSAPASTTTTSPSTVSTSASTSSTGVRFLLLILVFAHLVDNLIWNTQIFDRVSSDVYLWDASELFAVSRGANDFLHGEVHPGVTVGQVAVESFS